jgi:4a-hydroxytetrahydrobiopterin dehydratase
MKQSFNGSKLTRLSEGEIKSNLKKVKGWKRSGMEIKKTYKFDDFTRSMEFVNKVARLAEQADHHPDILIQYDNVTMTLSTHDEGGLTSRDFKLAQRMDETR